MMDIELMATAIRDIQKLQPALAWLKEYGHLLAPEEKSRFSVNIAPATASLCPGYQEATHQLSAAAVLLIEEIVQRAINDAENTIALRKQQIVDQAKE